MANSDGEQYENGFRTAISNVADGFPRWIQTTSGTLGEFIHPKTGLPIVEMDAQMEPFARGYNDEILSAIASGEITVDFRPLLMTLAEIQYDFREHGLGTLSEAHPRIESPSGDFVLELRTSKSKSKQKQHAWISYTHTETGRRPSFALYEGPVEIALGRDSRVLILREEHSFLTRDVLTTQVLNMYPIGR